MRKYLGTNFDKFLEEEGLLAESETAAIRRVIVWKVERLMEGTESASNPASDSVED